MAWWVRQVARAPWLTAGMILALTMVSGWYSVAHLSVNTDTVDMLSPELPFRKTYETYKQAFPQFIDTFVVVIDGRTPEQAREAARRLLQRMKLDDEHFASLYAPGLLPFFERNGLLFLDTDELEAQADMLAQIQPFLGRLARDQSLRGLFGMLGDALDASRQGEAIDLGPLLRQLIPAVQAALAGRDRPLSWQTLMAGGDDGPQERRQFIIVKPHLDYGEILPGAPAIEAVRAYAGELGISPDQGLRLRITGKVALEYEEMQSVSRGAGIAAVSALVLVLSVLIVGLRSVRLVAITLITLIAGLTLTAGFAAVAVGELNTISVAFGVLYIGLGVDFAIHLCLRYRELRERGEDGARAMRVTAADVGSSLLLCALSTAVGFYAFIPTAYSGVSELGLISGTGMFISLLASLTLLPALLHIWPLPATGAALPRPNATGAGALAAFPYRHARAIRAGALILSLAGIAAVPLARFDHHPINLRDADTESVSTFRELVEDDATPPWNITLLAADAAQAARLAQRLRALPSVDSVVNFADLVPEDQGTKLEIIEDTALMVGPELEQAGPVPPPSLDEQRAALSDLLERVGVWLAAGTRSPWHDEVVRLQTVIRTLLVRLDQQQRTGQEQQIRVLQDNLLRHLPDNLERLALVLQADEVTAGDIPDEVAGRWVTPGGTYRIVVYPREDISDSDALRRFVKEVRAVAPSATDIPVLNLEAGDAVVAAFIQAFAWALGIIVLLLALFLRNAVDVFMVLVPLLLATLLTSATLVALGMSFNFANVIALPLLLGIGVDNGIHMVHRMRYADRADTNLLRTSTARAVLFSGLTTIVSFVNLAFSSHPGTASMGLTLTLGVLFTVLSTLLILPALQPSGRDRPQTAAG